jgi:hypothetical protein
MTIEEIRALMKSELDAANALQAEFAGKEIPKEISDRMDAHLGKFNELYIQESRIAIATRELELSKLE